MINETEKSALCSKVGARGGGRRRRRRRRRRMINETEKSALRSKAGARGRKRNVKRKYKISSCDLSLSPTTGRETFRAKCFRLGNCKQLSMFMNTLKMLCDVKNITTRRCS
jgi:hypothetical protein